MGAPVPGMEAADDTTAEALLSSLKTIAASERRRHATVYNYWLSIRGDRQFPPIRDLDPLEISDAGPQSVLLELAGGGEDADIRHLGTAIKAGVEVTKIAEAPSPSLLSCIARNLPIVVASREPFAFEDAFESPDGPTRCWVTLLPFSATGTWIDYVYGFVSLDPFPADDSEAAETPADPGPVSEAVTAEAEEVAAPAEVEEAVDAEAPEPEQIDEVPPVEAEQIDEAADADSDEPEPMTLELDAVVGNDSGPGFAPTKVDDTPHASGYYGRVVEVETGPWTAEAVEPGEAADAPEPSPAPASTEPEEQISASEGPLETRLAEVRAIADEARLAKLRSNAALYEGLSAAYDFALDAESDAEEYLKLVEAQGLKIQLRSPMAPVVKLAFGGMCDDSTIARLEAVLAWALKQDLPRGSLAERLQEAGGIDAILGGHSAKG